MLITGLELGCVVRGLLCNTAVESIDVVEIDEGLIRIVGAEFLANPRIIFHHADAREFPADQKWDFAWHDIWTQRKRAGKSSKR